MKRGLKSPALKKNLSVASIALFLLGGCDTVPVPHVFQDDVPPSVVQAPRVVSTPGPSADQNWPRLGDVPSKPKDFPPQPVVDQAMREMRQDRAEAEDLRARVQQDTPGAVEP